MKKSAIKGFKAYADMNPEHAERMKDRLNSNGFGSALTSLAVEYTFGSVWNRTEFDRRQRSMVTIAILISLRQAEELKNHIELGLTNGLTLVELEEILIQSTVYAGFPAAWTAYNLVLEVCKKLGIDIADKV